MAISQKEKAAAITLLEGKIERMTGKKVTYINPKIEEIKKVYEQLQKLTGKKIVFENYEEGTMEETKEEVKETTAMEEKVVEEATKEAMGETKKEEAKPVEETKAMEEDVHYAGGAGGSKEALDKYLQTTVIPYWLSGKNAKGTKYKLTKQMYAVEMEKAKQDNYKGRWGTDPKTLNVVYLPVDTIRTTTDVSPNSVGIGQRKVG